MRVDAHQHYWKIARGDYGWIRPGMDLYRDFLPEDLVPQLHKHHMDGSILVQAAPTVEESRFILALSEKTDTVLGVVCWLDLTKPDYKKQFEEFAEHPKFAGFRVMIQDMPDPYRVLESDYIDALKYFAALDVPVDLLVTADQLPVLIMLLDKVPNLRGVLDHLGKPPIAAGSLQPWKDHITAVAAHPAIYCKISGMVTEAEKSGWHLDDFVPYVQHVIEEFGPNRVMFGSDWPVCLMDASYEDVYNIIGHSLPAMDRAEKEALYGNNAKEFYKL